MVFVNFFKNVTSKEDIEYVSNAFEPCTCDGKPESKAQAYSYYKFTYDKLIMPSPYQIFIVFKQDFRKKLNLIK